jgi:outer membrane protein OmpU
MVLAQTAGPKAPFTAVLDGSAVATFGVPSGNQNNGSAGGVANSHGRDLGMRQDADMRFKFEGKADNGLIYGYYVRIEGESSSISIDSRSINREWLYLNSSYGNVQFGAAANVATSTFGGACGLIVPANYGPCGAPNQLGPDGDLEATLLTDPNAISINGALAKTGASGGSRPGFGTKIRYDSPSIAGFVFRASYEPDGKQRNEEQFTTDTVGAAALSSSTDEGSGYTARFQNYFETSLTYTGTFGPIANMSSVVFTHADPKDITFGTAAVKPVNGTIVGTQFAYAGWSWGVAYNWTGTSGYTNTLAQPNGAAPVKSWGWSTGVEYDTGPWQMGAWYQYARSQGSFTTNGLIELNYVGAGAAYTIAPGLKAFGEAFYYNDYNTHPFVVSAATGTSAANFKNPKGQIYLFGMDFEW